MEENKIKKTKQKGNLPIKVVGENKQKKKKLKDKKTPNSVKVLRTYKNDVADILNKQKISLTGVVISEQKKRKKEGNLSKKTRETTVDLKILLSVIIAIAIGGFLTYSQIKNPDKKQTEITKLEIPNFIFPNYQREVFFKNLKKTTIINTIKEEEGDVSIPLGSIIQFFFTSKDKTKSFVIEELEGNKLLVTIEVFLNSLKTRVSDSLTRALQPDFVFGYHSSLGNNPFLILKIKSYKNVFEGMLNWENTIVKELFPFFKKEKSSIDLNNYTFKDIIVVNKDVRALLDKEGKIEFAYSIFNKETLIIVNNETTLKEIFRRLNTAKLERR